WGGGGAGPPGGGGALRPPDGRAGIAPGASDPAELGPVPGSWLVRGFLPQVTVLRHSALAVTHGGNNSVTEAMTSAVPLLVLPFSTDQFAGAAAIERAGFGLALAPNTATADELRVAAAALLALDGDARLRLDRLGDSLSDGAGPRRAFAVLGAVPAL
ncbi:MAG: glycosyltransferase, partial [Ramlibacter sp.]|nr:glycosyltransferase [Cryobacterium sp.]